MGTPTNPPSGTTVIAVGLQDADGINMNEVRAIATPSPTNKYSFQVNDLSQVTQIEAVADSIADIVCTEF